LYNEVLKCFVGAAYVRMHFARESTEGGVNIAPSEPHMQLEGPCGCLKLRPNILADALGSRLEQQRFFFQ